MRRVAYETLGRADRRARHLATARHLEQGYGAGVARSPRCSPTTTSRRSAPSPTRPDAAELADRACGTLAAAGDRAAGLAAHAEAARYYEQAAELARDDLRRAGMLEQAGRALWRSAQTERAVEVLGRAVELFDAAGESRSAARTRSWIGEVHIFQGRVAEAVEQFERALAVLSEGGPCAELAFASLGLGSVWILEGDVERGEPWWMPAWRSPSASCSWARSPRRCRSKASRISTAASARPASRSGSTSSSWASSTTRAGRRCGL